MNSFKPMLRGVILATTMTLAGGLMTASPASADVTGPPTAPTFYDACQASMDLAWHSDHQDYVYRLYKDGVEQDMMPDVQYAISGSTHVQIDAVNMLTGGQIIQSWTYDYDTTAPCGTPAPNVFSAVASGPCVLGDDRTPVTASVNNWPDVYKQYLPYVYVRAVRLTDKYSPGEQDAPMEMVLDGQTKSLAVGSAGGGLPTGEFSIRFFSDAGYSQKMGETDLIVKGCDLTPPAGAEAAIGTLRLKGCVAVAKANARKVSTSNTVTYRLAKKLPHAKKPKFKTFTVKGGYSQVVRKFGRKSTKFVFQVRLGTKWRNLGKPVVVSSKSHC